MTYYELLECSEFLQDFKLISSISRVDDNTLKIDFSEKITIYASLKRGFSTLFMCDDFKRGKRYQAPFDVALAKRFSNAAVESLEVSQNDRVLNIKAAQKNSYKITISTLVLEFTGKNTNAVILDDCGVVVEALRHIDKDMSYRVVKVGEKLQPLPSYQIKKQPIFISDKKAFLYGVYEKTLSVDLQNLKNSKCAELQKKIAKLNATLNSLESEEELDALAKENAQKASLLLGCRHLLSSYGGKYEFEDVDGEKQTIIFNEKDPQKAIDELFAKSKKLKQRAKSIYMERENLREKSEFSTRLLEAVLNAKSKEEVEILLPKRESKIKKEEQSGSFASFFIDGYKVMVGKNSKGNAELLRTAKKNDIWFHIKDIPSAHAILKTDKSVLPNSVILFCAKLCLSFSGAGGGRYEVDYTQRRNVRVCEGSLVNYTDYKTININKE